MTTRRRLPHWHPAGHPVFVTWCLHGVLPSARFPPPTAKSAGQAFVFMDRYLDEARTGAAWLAQPKIAKMVVDSIRHCEHELKLFDVDAYAVMPNHVHLLGFPHVPLAKLMQTLKGFTGREGNKMLNRTGEAFWQHESYDRWIRDDKEMERVRRYVELNPVRAGLAVRAEEFPWSSAAEAGSKAGPAS